MRTNKAQIQNKNYNFEALLARRIKTSIT